MIRDWVKVRLTLWGRWARGGLPSLPTMSPIEKARMGRGGASESEMPPDIAEVDHLVCIAPKAERKVLIVHYTQRGTIAHKASRCGVDPRSFRRRLEQAESFIAYRL